MLASKLATQEELLIKSKNQSLQKIMGDAQSLAGHWYRKFKLPVPEMNRLQISYPGDGDGSVRKSVRLSQTEPDRVQTSILKTQATSTGSNLYTSASSRATTAIRMSLQSPRMIEDGGTFLTEIDYQQEPADADPSDTTQASGMGQAYAAGEERKQHVGFTPSAAPTGSLASTGMALASAQRALPREDVAPKRALGQTVHFGATEQFAASHRPGDADLRSHTLPARALQYGEQTMDAQAYRPLQDTHKLLQDTAYSDPLSGLQLYPQGSKEEVRPPWNSWKKSFLSQSTAPVYTAPTRRGAGHNKSSLSPYLVPQAGKGKQCSSSARTMPRDSVRAAKLSQSELERSRSVSARPAVLHEDGGPAAQHRASSTLPIISAPDRTGGRASSTVMGEDRTIFPHLDSGARVTSEARPTDTVLPKSGNFTRLETWIEDKIKMILTGASDGSAGLDLTAGQASQSVQSLGSTARDAAAAAAASTASGMDASRVGGQAPPAQAAVVSSIGGHALDELGAEGGKGVTGEARDGGEINQLLNRLKATMAADSAPAKAVAARGVLRHSMDPLPAAAPNQGLSMADPRQRAATLAEKVGYFRGTEVDQQTSGADDVMLRLQEAGPPTEEGDEEREEVRRLSEEDRRNRLSQVAGAVPTPAPAAGFSSARPGKTAKRVLWSMDDGPDGSDFVSLPGGDPAAAHPDAFRPETGVRVNGIHSRPGTSASFLPPISPHVDGDDMEDEENAPRAAADGDLQEAAGNRPIDMERDFFSLVRHNKVKEFEEALVRLEIPVDSRDRYGNTPLTIASQNGHKRLVKLALANGADPNASNHQGNTALHFANQYGYTTVANYLISKGADDTLMNHQGKTCYDK